MNLYQNTKGIFHRTRKNNVKICMEIQKTLNSQNNPEKEESLTSDYTTKLQSSKQYGSGIKTDIQISGTG